MLDLVVKVDFDLEECLFVLIVRSRYFGEHLNVPMLVLVVSHAWFLIMQDRYFECDRMRRLTI
jgi:hypothetical protein